MELVPILLLLLYSAMLGGATNFFMLSATTLSGKMVQFSQYRGKVSSNILTNYHVLVGVHKYRC